MPYSVDLTNLECRLASLLGSERGLASLLKPGTKARQSIGGERQDAWANNVFGGHSELATAKFLNCYWNPTINHFKGADLADFIQVRSRRLARYELYVREEDNKDHAYILVHYEYYPRFVIMGWRWGHEVVSLGRLENPGGYGEAHFLSPDKLLDFDVFPWERLRAWRSGA